jgi:hypothetical protein
MIRQARIYLAGGISSTALIATAVVLFVALVSLQTFDDWPLNALGVDRKGATQDRPTAAGARGPVAAGAPSPGTPDVQAPAGQDQPSTAVGGAIGGTPDSPGDLHEAVSAPVRSPTAGVGGSARRGTADGSPRSGGANAPAGEGDAPSLSETATGAVDETVAGLDSITGGALGRTGATGPVEETVNRVAGPESALGKTVDRITEAVGDLPGGDR